MRFMMLMKADEASEAGMPPSPEMMEEVGKYSMEMARAGALIATGGLGPSSKSSRIRLTGGKLTVIDGPFAETKELIGGYAIIEANSKEEAIGMGAEFLRLHQRVLGDAYTGECDVRPLFEAPVG